MRAFKHSLLTRTRPTTTVVGIYSPPAGRWLRPRPWAGVFSCAQSYWLTAKTFITWPAGLGRPILPTLPRHTHGQATTSRSSRTPWWLGRLAGHSLRFASTRACRIQVPAPRRVTGTASGPTSSGICEARSVYVYRGRVSSGGQEKGVDVSLALDLVRATYERRYEAAIVVSQDWDFGPAVRLAKLIAQSQKRSLVFESSFPVGPGNSSRRGVPGTTWVPIDQATYDACHDPTDYRPRR